MPDNQKSPASSSSAISTSSTTAGIDQTIANKQLNLEKDENKKCLNKWENEKLIEETKCKIFGNKINCLQRYATPFYMIFWFCFAGALQGFIVNGLVHVSLSTIEKRYQLKSTEIGLIAGSYDIASLIFLVPVSYCGGNRSKPLFLSLGVLTMALGSIIFSSPYFFSGIYEFSVEHHLTCSTINSNVTFNCDQTISKSSLSNYKYLFAFGQFLLGVGAAPLWTLGCTYIDENVSLEHSSIYIGIFYTMSLLGPGCGFIVGGQFLKIYVDWLYINVLDVGLSASSDVWVGAWWIGFLIGASIAILIAIPIYILPKRLPKSLEYQSNRMVEIHKNSANSKAMDKDFGKTLTDLPASFLILISNPTFIFLNFAAAIEGMLTSATATFLPKIVQQQFNVQPSTAALLVGLTSIPGAGGGTFLGGYLIKHYKLKISGILRYSIICTFIAAFSCTIFLFACDTTKLAGYTINYQESDKISKIDNFNSNCNTNCNCSIYNYDPICGIDNRVYYSPCFAGCEEMTMYKGIKVYSSCACINNKTVNKQFDFKPLTIENPIDNKLFNIEAIRSKCKTDCNLLPIFLLFIFITMFFTFLVSMPSLTATLRCVADSQKSFALGLQWVMVRILGTIPAPFIFGSFIDLSCLLWQKSCDRETGACILYDNQELSIYLVAFIFTFKILSAIFFVLSLLYYKPLNEQTQPNEIIEKNQLNNIEPQMKQQNQHVNNIQQQEINSQTL